MLLSHKENNLNMNLNKNISDNLFLTNFKDSNENKIVPNSLMNSNYKSNKIQVNNMINNSALNNSISQQNLNTLMNESTNNIYLNKDGVSNFPASPKMGNKHILISSIQKVNNRPLSPSNNQINISKNINSNILNLNNQNNQNYDFQNTSFSSNASIFINKSIRNFSNSNNNLINRPNSINRYENLFTTRIFSANNLNQNLRDRKNVRTLLKTNDNSEINDTINARARSSNINNAHNKTRTKISNKERDLMFKIKKLNEEISKITPVQEEELEKLAKKGDFKRGGNMKKLRSEFRSSKFYQDKNYEKITSNFKKSSLDKMNAFYADKFNLNVNMNVNLNIKLSLNNPNYYNQNGEEMFNDYNLNNNSRNEENKILKEQNPISIFNLINYYINIFSN